MPNQVNEPVAYLARVIRGSLAGNLILVDKDEKLNSRLYKGPFPVFREAQQPQGKPVASHVQWEECERIANVPGVHEALTMFSEDSTGDAGTALVREVLIAAHIEKVPQAR